MPMLTGPQAKRIPRYIEERIRRPIPRGRCVVPGSTPVVAFGNCLTARVATLGLNPSRREFLDRKGALLKGDRRRLASRKWLGVSDLSRVSQEVIIKVFEECNRYFQRDHYAWFDKLEPVLRACGASYCDGSACHLDLVQWATDPTWGKLLKTKPLVCERLIADDLRFLRKQLKNATLQLLLINGTGVRTRFQHAMDLELAEADVITKHGKQKTRLYTGELDHVRVVAWSTNLQNAYTSVSPQRHHDLARRVAALARGSRRG